jgi:uroporphyrinogen-III synthase
MVQPTTLLLTRPRAVSEVFAQQVQDAVGPLQILIAPLIEIEFLEIDAVPNAQTIIFTSRNGVLAWERAELPTTAQCYCVGQVTADAAHALGFEVHVSGGTVEHLVDDLKNAAPAGKILHVHGEHTRGNLVERLIASGLNACGLIAYEQHLLELSHDAQTLLLGGAPVIVPLFSPRTAAQFAKTGPYGSQVDVIAISNSAAQACPGAHVAPSPNVDGMITAIKAVLSA